LWGAQNGRCAISGLPLIRRTFGTKKAPNVASLDRINSEIGYIKGNVQFVAYSLNLAKQDFSSSDFLAFYHTLIQNTTTLVSSSENYILGALSLPA
jgi:hypothetical protein